MVSLETTPVCLKYYLCTGNQVTFLRVFIPKRGFKYGLLS